MSKRYLRGTARKHRPTTKTGGCGVRSNRRPVGGGGSSSSSSSSSSHSSSTSSSSSNDEDRNSL